ncbi:MAG: protein kinase [Deltaproteobacteria bacterium]|nr:protein kinase [Deltaproteobacteria bacterium]
MTRFGEFELIEKIAEGGMAEIYLARRAENHGISRTIVVKRMLPELSIRKDFVNMFLDEGRLAANITHPNVVQVFNLGKVDGSYYMSMELVDGPHLGALFAHSLRTRKPLPLAFCVYAIARAADGLHFAHELHDNVTGKPLEIVHRDISPQNILVSKHGDVKVTDFGVAKASTQEAKTRTGVIKGKVSYMSPEQCLGENLDRRTDLFALGVCLYELVTRRRLFRERSDLLSMQRITTENVKTPSKLNAEIDEELDSILLKVLEKDRHKRYENASELSKALDVWLALKGHADCHEKLSHWMAEFAPDLGVGEPNPSSGSLPALKPVKSTQNEATASASTNSFDKNAPDSVSTTALIPTLGQNHEPQEDHNGALPTQTMGSLSDASDPEGISPKASTSPIEFKIKAPDEDDSLFSLDEDGTPNLENEAAVEPFALGPKQKGFPLLPMAAAAGALFLVGVVALVLIFSSDDDKTPNETGKTAGAAQLFKVKIDSSPSGANISVQGVEKGKTPLELEIPTGKQVVRARFVEEGRYLEQEIDVTKDAEMMLYAPAKLSFSVKPSGAEIEIDGENVGKTPLGNLWISRGKHDILVKKTGHLSARKKVDVSSDQPVALSFSLKKSDANGKKRGSDDAKGKSKKPKTAKPIVKKAQGKATLTVYARPWINVRVGNKKLGATPIVDKTIPAGKVLLRLDNEAADLHLTTYVALKKGRSGQLNLNFEKKNGRWKIATRRFVNR